MALAKTYDTLNGRIRGENSGRQTNYLTDALGSVTATVSSKPEVVTTYRYKPYGSQLAKTGSEAEPRFLWTGNTGSRYRLVNATEHYNRMRHYGPNHATWTSKDPFFPKFQAYSYANGNPATLSDPTGLVPARDCCCCPKLLHPILHEHVYGPDLWGTKFTLAVKFELVETPLGAGVFGGRCMLQWWERTNVPYVTGWNGSWCDLFDSLSPCYIPLSQQRILWETGSHESWKQCPPQRADEVRIPDFPAITRQMVYGTTSYGYRQLCFRWVLKAQDQCKLICEQAGHKTEVSETAVQDIDVWHHSNKFGVKIRFSTQAKCDRA